MRSRGRKKRIRDDAASNRKGYIQERLPALLEQEGIVTCAPVRPLQATFYPLKAFDDNRSQPITIVEGHHPLPRTLDKHEIAILQMLEKDHRTRIVDIANALNISSELALYKTRKLFNEHIVLGSRIQFDMSKLGYFFSGVLINLKTPSRESIMRLKRVAQQLPTINSFVVSFNQPNFLMQIIHKDQQELRYAVEQIRKALQDTDASIEIVLLTEEEKVNTLPFIEDLKTPMR
jgi:DNA-binding Lrp family transcriptional regulator